MSKSTVLHLKLKHPDQKPSFDKIDDTELTPTWPPGKTEPMDNELQKATAADKKVWDATIRSYHLPPSLQCFLTIRPPRQDMQADLS